MQLGTFGGRCIANLQNPLSVGNYGLRKKCFQLGRCNCLSNSSALPPSGLKRAMHSGQTAGLLQKSTLSSINWNLYWVTVDIRPVKRVIGTANVTTLPVTIYQSASQYHTSALAEIGIEHGPADKGMFKLCGHSVLDNSQDPYLGES